jgi:MFS family permease
MTGHRSMPTLTIQRPAPASAGGPDVDPFAPRDDILVAERPVPEGSGRAAVEGDAEFESVAGAFSTWHRSVRREPDGSSVETVTYSLRLGVWTPLFAVPVRRLVRRGASPTERPWWLPPDRLDPQGAAALSAGCSLAVVGAFLAGQLTQVLTFVARDFGAGVDRQTDVLLVVRAGALVTLAGTWLADRHGRRPVALGALLLAAVAGVATAAAPSLAVAAGLQLVCRSAAVVGILLLPVCAAEELPAGSRAFATGLLAMAGGLGVGLVIVTLPLADLSPHWSWRLLFLTGALALPAIVVAGRRLPETRRYAALRVQEVRHRPVAHLQGARLAALGIALVALNAFVTPVSQLQNEFLRDARGFSATRVSVFLILTGSLGGLGVVVGGRLADRWSRHLVGTIGLLGLAAGNAVMYATHGWPMWVASTVGSAIGAACVPVLGVLNPELFPTSRRGAASGALNVAGVVGAVAGLLVARRFIDSSGYGRTIGLLAIGPLVVVALLRSLPETARLTLEELNPGDVDGAPPAGAEP